MIPRTAKAFSAAAALAAAAFGCATPAMAQAGTAESTRYQPTEDDFVILEMRVKNFRLPLDIRGYQLDGGVCLDLADVIQSLDLPVRLDKKSRRATGWLFSEDQVFTLDREANTVQNVNSRNAPLANDIYDTPEGWCVDTKALGRWFGVTFTHDLYNSIVTLESEKPLPFLQAMERRSRAARLKGKKKKAFDLSAFPSQDMEYKLWRTPSVDVNVRSSVAMAPGQKTRTQGRVELYAAGEALGVSYNARLATDNRLSPTSLRVQAFRFDPEAGLLGPLKARQVIAGDVQGESGQLTAQGGVGRGVAVNNLPIGRDRRFSTTDLRGTMPAGWDAELYRNGQLIAFLDAPIDGRYEFLEVDLFYGRNDFEVVLYGPQGQEKREVVSFPVGGSLLEPGTLHYWFNALQDRRDLIDLRSNSPPGVGAWRLAAGFDYGIDKRTSASLSAHSIDFAGRRRSYVEGLVNRSFGAFQIQAGGAHEIGAGFSGIVQGNGQIGRFNLGASVLWVSDDYTSEFVSSGVKNKFTFQADTSLRLGRVSVPIQAAVNRSNLRNGSTSTQASLATSIALKRLSLTAQVGHGQFENALTGETSKNTTLQLLANAQILGVRVRGAANFDLSGPEKGLRNIRLSTRKSLSDRNDVSIDVDYIPSSKTATFGAGYTHTFDRFALNSTLNYSTDGAIGAGISLAFSLGPDPVNGGIRVSQRRLARGGQAVVNVFRDTNGDGVRSADEPMLPDVTVTAGLAGTSEPTNEEGRTVVDTLKPFRPVLVGIDASSLDDPFLAPASEGVVIVPRPGVHAEIDIPISATGEVEGVILSSSGRELGGLDLELMDTAGRVVASTISEFDGFFLFERVPYGNYRLRVAPGIARQLKVKTALATDVTINSDSDIARLGTIQLEEGVPAIIAGVEADPSIPVGRNP
ncbi:hypothetical protein [Parerythrobacter jejuensis]|uniref:Carboxypeptidase regulatory-like domain-containing protein n=1 Tax=Parerythrobacter jejuensis TaxID=795812 RepID=A0A845AMU4_9SPHN|nr:hypothetical protein [Parerythrobacter jejuensis]MXP30934.1 hypothetical protein [Parerythrobacter jejuensis]MXP33694.1 hypothetical protein [Parerythrobacter jejuensis]